MLSNTCTLYERSARTARSPYTLESPWVEPFRGIVEILGPIGHPAVSEGAHDHQHGVDAVNREIGRLDIVQGGNLRTGFAHTDTACKINTLPCRILMNFLQGPFSSSVGCQTLRCVLVYQPSTTDILGFYTAWYATYPLLTLLYQR